MEQIGRRLWCAGKNTMKTITIGRNTDNDIVIGDPYISGRHASLTRNDNGSISIRDLGSANGTFVNGSQISESTLRPSDVVKLGNTIIPWADYFRGEPDQSFAGNIVRELNIGRNHGNHIVIGNEFVSGMHATLFITDLGEVIVQDQGSTNGTFVNDRKISVSMLKKGDKVRLGKAAFEWEKYLSPAIRKRQRKRRLHPWFIAGIVAGSMVLLLATVWMVRPDLFLSEKRTSDSIPSDTIPVFNNLSQLIQHIEQAVFAIESRDRSGRPVSYGTGFFISSTGIGITNAHVTRGGSAWAIRTSAGQEYRIENILVTNNTYDYCIFKVHGQGFPFLEAAPQSALKGEEIIVLGNPQGIESTLTKGIVSGYKGGTEKDIISGRFSEGRNFIQIDVAISHGSSGSPVMNMKGQVVGVATLSFEEANCINCNFAVNIEMLRSDIEKLLGEE